MTELVALLHQGRVLITPAGTLPELPPLRDGADERSLAEVLALVGAEIPIAPTAKLADGRLVHLVGMRDADPPPATAGADLAPPAAVADAELAQVLQRALDELDPAHTPAQRPDWFRPGWFDLLEAWIDAALAPTGRRRAGPVEPFRLWSISAVVRVPTDDGVLWCKAPCPYFRTEARIHSAVARLLPDLVPDLVATEPDEGWLLMRPMTGADDPAPGAALEVARCWASAQLASIERVPALLAAGLQPRGVDETIAAFEALLRDSGELVLLSDDELREARAAAGPAIELVRRFWAAGIPDALAHGDLHLGNVAWDGADLRIFDWTDGCISHPFLDASHLVRFVDDATGADALRSYADAWRDVYPDVDVDTVVALAPLADLVFQTVTFDELAKATEPQSAWELGGVIARNLRALPQLVARSTDPR